MYENFLIGDSMSLFTILIKCPDDLHAYLERNKAEIGDVNLYLDSQSDEVQQMFQGVTSAI